MLIPDLLIRSAHCFPHYTAVVHEDRRISYAELHQAAVQVSLRLGQSGFVHGSRMAILCENTIEYPVAFFGALQAGLVAVPLDTSLPPQGLAGIINDCGAEVLFCQAKFRRKVLAFMDQCPSLRLVLADESFSIPDRQTIALADIVKTGANIPAVSAPGIADSALAAIFYTSGSTGAGKGVMLSHRNLGSNTLATVEYLKLTEADSVLVILPFYYIYGNSLLLTHIATGGRLVIDNRFLYPEAVLDTMEREEVTGFSGVPSNFQILLGKSTFASRRFAKLRYITQAGGAMATETIHRLQTACPDKEVYIMYGQTEASPRISYVPPEKLVDKIGSVGIPLSGVEVLVVDENDRETPVGETGEVVVAGPNVMLGYWRQPEETAQVLKNGRLYTGDLGRKDVDGYLYIVGRKKEIIKCGGLRVSAKEIEECLLAHPKILEATVFGVEDPVLGEAVKAVVVVKSDETMDQKDLVQHCRRNLPDYKVPKYISFADSLPKYQSGKVNKLVLKAEHVGSQ